MRVGIVGFGHLGQYLVEKILENGEESDVKIAFVWNRSTEKINGKVEDKLVLEKLEDFPSRHADLIVEVSHPDVCKAHGEKFLQHADLFLGSPTSFGDRDTEVMLRNAAETYNHSIYVPSGALWGAADIKKMADRGTLQGLKITMKKHPSAFRLSSELQELNKRVQTGDFSSALLYEGPVRKLCSLAPNNVNTMAAGAIAAHNLGFDEVVGCLISDSNLLEWHIVEVEVTGPGDAEAGNAFAVSTTRKNPAAAGVVTGNATFASFFSSLVRARNKGPGVHLC